MMLLLAEYADRMPIVGIQKTLRRRHSRTGGNPGLCISGIFKDFCNLKLLDSRLRGNDGLDFFVSNLYIQTNLIEFIEKIWRILCLT